MGPLVGKRSPSRWEARAVRASVQTMDELLEVVAARQAMAITGQFVADAYRNPGVVFVPIEDIDPCPLSLCTRADDFSPLVNALRRALRRFVPDATKLADVEGPVPRWTGRWDLGRYSSA